MHWGSKIVFQKQTPHHDIRVEDCGPCRYLFSGKGRARQQSCMNLADPHEHMLNYSSLVFSSLLFVPHPRRVLVLGLGGATIPREFMYYLPDATVDVIEIDPEMVNIARDFFFLKDNARLNIRLGDGRDVMQEMASEAAGRFDTIVLDAFSSEYVPRHLMTVEFLETVSRLLADTGVVAANIFNSHPLYPNQVRSFMDVFPERLHELRGTFVRTTSVLFATGPAVPALRSDAEDQAAHIKARLGLRFSLRVPQRVGMNPSMFHANPLRDG